MDRLAELGAKFWLKPAPENNDWDGIRAEIIGMQRRIELWLDLLDRESWRFRFEAEDDLLDFFAAVTDGSFEDRSRPADPKRAEMIYVTASTLILKIRGSRRGLLKDWV